MQALLVDNVVSCCCLGSIEHEGVIGVGGVVSGKQLVGEMLAEHVRVVR